MPLTFSHRQKDIISGKNFVQCFAIKVSGMLVVRGCLFMTKKWKLWQGICYGLSTIGILNIFRIFVEN
jgi:hypothetical protein